MNFFELQAAARRDSRWLVVLFVLAVLMIVGALELVAWSIVGPSPQVLAWVAVVTLAIIGLGSLYRLAGLAGGGEAVARQLGGERVAEDTADPDLRRLRNVVEEVAIASGVPVPGLYVLEHEPGINAFAAGHSASDAVVAVTRGALERLNRDELQGVVAHEFSHILNGDMRLNMRLLGVLFGISVIALIGQRILQFGALGHDLRGRRGAGVGFVLIGLVALAVGWVGLVFARMIRAAVSRSRERLADASAVQFTRQRAGLAGALKKIGGLADGSTLSSRGDAEEVSHMLFGEGVAYGSLASRLFATHPPLLERIQVLEPGFRPADMERLSREWMQRPPLGLDEDAHLGFHDGRLPAPGSEQRVEPARVAAQVARPDPDDRRAADHILDALPPELRQLAVDRERVMALVLGLLLDPDPAVAGVQLEEIRTRLGKTTAMDAEQLRRQQLAGLHPMLRIPLAELSFPVLRRRPRPQLEAFLDAVHAVGMADGRLSLFEYCLGRVLTLHLRESLSPARHAGIGRRQPAALRNEIATLLAVVASAGHGDEAGGRHAYLAGLQRILPGERIDYRPPSNAPLALEQAWVPLDALDPLAKRVLVEAVTVAISHDGRVTVAESELLRTVCALLHCPLPPLPGRA